MAEAEMPSGDALLGGHGGGLAVQAQRRGTRRGPGHLYVAQGEAAQAHAESLHHRLLGREASGQALGWVAAAPHVGPLGLAEEPLGQAGRARQG